jgi:XTP/dITP diphosphohydrolase
MRIIFATNNPHKVKEVKDLAPSGFNIVSLKDAGIVTNIPEPYDTLEANAAEKSRVIETLTRANCFSEDTGLEVEALNGEPGVRSARYAGDAASDKMNVELLLKNLGNHPNRKARFRTVISLRCQGMEYLFEGICPGSIALKPLGSAGFGYDPVFVPDGADRTFAQMTAEEKHQYSHRGKAMAQLIDFFLSINIG